MYASCYMAVLCFCQYFVLDHVQHIKLVGIFDCLDCLVRVTVDHAEREVQDSIFGLPATRGAVM